MLSTRFLTLLLRLFGRLPLPAAQSIGVIFGLLFWASRSRMYLVTRENVALCFPDLNIQDQNRLVRASLVETGKTIVESALAWTARPARCEAAIKSVEGKEQVDTALIDGKGLIFVIPHLGNWEMINHYLGKHYGLVHMYQRNPSRSLNAMIQGFRERTGTRFVETTRKGIKAQITALKTGKTIGAMPDQEPEVHTGQFARFFGVECLTNSLVPNLARKHDAAVVVTWCERLAAGRGFRIVFEPVSFQNISSDQNALQQLNDGLEHAIRRMPEQYLWSYKRFRTRPEGEEERYQFRQHPVLVTLAALSIRLFMAICARIPTRHLQRLGSTVGGVIRRIRTRRARITRTNLTLCASALKPLDIRRLEDESLRELAKAAMETGKIWHATDSEFRKEISGIEGLEHLPPEREQARTIVLTPPLGNREVVLRFLSRRYKLTDYYYPNTTTARDDLIRRQRAIWNIDLVPHAEWGVKRLCQSLLADQLITLCPDQQPRLRAGIFVRFFGFDALTNRIIPRLIAETGAPLVFAAAIRDDDGFRIHFHQCNLSDVTNERAILRDVNRQLEEIVRPHLTQYRWSDKRFNIRPPGERKVYR